MLCCSYVKYGVSLCPRSCSTQSICSVSTSHLNIKSANKHLLWQTQGLAAGQRAPTQILFQDVLQALFPQEDIYTSCSIHIDQLELTLQILFNVRKEMNIKPLGYGGGYLEVDAYIPRLKLPLEYQDPFHYTPTVYYTNRPLAEIQKIDCIILNVFLIRTPLKQTLVIKKRTLEERGEPLVQIPCWWNGEADSLAASIKAIRPDLLEHLTPSCPPISDAMPDNFFQVHVVPGVGTPMRPVFFSEQYYKRGHKWLMSEKYDGIRGFWNAEAKNLYHNISMLRVNRIDKHKYSRQGNILHFSDYFKQLMPNKTLDGEIWGGIGQFQDATKLQPNATKAAFPLDIKFIAFDLADPESQKLPYTERYQKLLSIIDPEHPFLVSFQKAIFNDVFLDSNEMVPNRILEESEKKRHEFERLIAKGGGEGLMLTESNSPYECGNTDKVLKIKPERDTEVLVISGDNKSLTVEMTNSTRFKILAPKQLERELPKPGDVVTITFKRYVNGSILPHRPAIKRIRRDLTWDDVKALSNDHHMPTSQDRDRDFSERWDIDIGGPREHLIQFAKKQGFDPLVPDNWYQISGKEIFAVKGASNMLRAFCRSFIAALVASFPELKFDKSKFLNVPRRHWANAQNIKAWFDDFARKKGFDPLIADNWYNVTRDDICGGKSGDMLKYYGQSHSKALNAIYPDIGLDESKFSKVPNYYWKNTQNFKVWFDNFARTKGFDPLIADSWYKISFRDIRNAKGGYGILRHHGRSHIKALKATYPGIGLDESKFSRAPSNYWENAQNTKAWFDNFAKTEGFDPLIADNWYNVTHEDIRNAKGSGMLNGRSHAMALKAAYHDIGLDESKFFNVPRNYWKSVQNARAWLDEFANKKGFDPLVPENWKKVSHLHICAVKGGYGLLTAFNDSLKKVLSAAYSHPY